MQNDGERGTLAGMETPENAPPTAPRPTWRDALIAAFVIIQIALPLSYYVGRSDSPLAPFDERFAWRMFSPVRLAKCQVRVYDATHGNMNQTISLSRELHVVWVKLLNRARPSIVDGVVDRFCQQRGADADVRLSMVCTRADAPAKTICEGDDDRNRDGVPDAYVKSHYCGDLSPRDCFAQECGQQSAAECYATECRVQLFDREENLCRAGGV